MRAASLSILLLLAAGCHAAPSRRAAPSPRDEGAGHAVLWYLPNRLFDLGDVVRARLRLGPGLALGLRATRHLDLHLGAEASAWIGLPGPRGEPAVNLPGGVEWRTGPFNVFGIDDYPEVRPYDAPWQLGLGAHLLLVGVDLALAPTEAWDALVGLAAFDPKGDDL